MKAKLQKALASKEFKASIVFVFASVCSQGMALISLPAFTRMLTTDQMGVVTTYNTWLNPHRNGDDAWAHIRFI